MEDQLCSMAKTNNGPRTLTQDIVVSLEILAAVCSRLAEGAPGSWPGREGHKEGSSLRAVAQRLPPQGHGRGWSRIVEALGSRSCSTS